MACLDNGLFDGNGAEGCERGTANGTDHSKTNLLRSEFVHGLQDDRNSDEPLEGDSPVNCEGEGNHHDDWLCDELLEGVDDGDFDHLTDGDTALSRRLHRRSHAASLVSATGDLAPICLRHTDTKGESEEDHDDSSVLSPSPVAAFDDKVTNERATCSTVV